MAEPMRSKGGGISAGSLVIGGVGLLCCVCSLILAFSPNAPKRPAVHGLGEDAPQSSRDGDAVQHSALDMLKDPDAQSDELEHPAILLDADSLEWEKGANTTKTTSGGSMAEAVSIRSVGIEPEVDPGTTEYSAATGGSGRCALTSALLNYTLRRIQNAKLSLEPYPHLYVNHVFEPSFYKECILARLPPTEAYQQLPNNRNRNQIPISGKYGHGPAGMNRVGRPEGSLDPKKARLMDVEFWTNFAKLFGSEPMMKTWLSKFYPTLQHRSVAARVGNMRKNYYYVMALGRDLRGYSIGPHTDTADKWVTTLFYLPKDNKHPELGTAVVKSPSGKIAKGNFRGSLNGKDFVIAKKAEFVPNAVMAFSACQSSWHAVQQVPGVILRDTIQGFVSGSPAGGKKQCGKPGDDLKAPFGRPVVPAHM